MVEDKSNTQKTFQWEAILADGKIVKESTGAKFDLAWEEPGAVKLFELKEVSGDSKYSLNLETGEFNLDGKTELPVKGKNLALRFFRRNHVRMDLAGNRLGQKVMYFLGHMKDGKKTLLKIEPELGQTKGSTNFITE